MKEFPDFITHLQKQLTLPLPGKEHQFRMAHIARIAEIPIRPDVRNAAVLVLLYQLQQEWHVVLIRRTSIDGDVHGGQISFPGGRAQSDETLEETATRESHEEIGSPILGVVPIGRLTRLHIPVSNHLVFPIVAYLKQYQGWIPQASEVDLILEVPVEKFLDPEARVVTSIRLHHGMVLNDVPCFKIEEHHIWGATAMILSEFIEIIRPLNRTAMSALPF